jgi:hypothetical protein
MLERCDPRCRSGRDGSVVLPLLASMLKGGDETFFISLPLPGALAMLKI